VGQPLGAVWYQWPEESQVEMVQQIVDLELKLMSISFLKHGSIYYKADLDSKATLQSLSVSTFLSLQ
jgi:DNA-directed RNA polymerase alpha subunit